MTIRCRIFGHKFKTVDDYTQCDTGFYKQIRVCRRCDYSEDATGCIRDDGKWAAHQIASSPEESDDE